MKFLNSKNSTLNIQLPNGIESNIILAGGGFGSFAFVEALACVSGQSKCAKCGLAKIELKNVRWGK